VNQASSAAGPDNCEWFFAALERKMRSCFAAVNDTRLHYLEWGEQSADAPTLVFVHGFRASAHWWDAVAPFFIDDYRVLVPDLTGMGDSAHRGEYPADIYAKDLIALIEEQCRGPVTVIGHSFGGARALQACAARPDLFKHAIIIDSVILFDDEHRFRGPTVRGEKIYPDLKTAVSRFRLTPEQPDVLPEIVKHIARHSVRQVPGGWTWKFDWGITNIKPPDLQGTALLGQIVTPTDFLYGEHSPIVSTTHAERIVASLTQAPKRGPTMLAGGYHHLMCDQPLALTQHLRELLAKPPA
jgi:pimeloyl-ACP methyl ester carboxylesterase